MILKSVLSIILMVHVVFAECTDVDYSAELKEVRLQGDMEWCYANSAADMISYKFRHQWNGFQASAIWIALLYNLKQYSTQTRNYIFLGGGDQKFAMSYAGEFDFSCPRQLDNILMNGGLKTTLKQKFQMVTILKKLYDESGKSEDALKAYQKQIQILRSQKSIISLLSDQQLADSLRRDINSAVLEMAKQVCQPFKNKMPMKLTPEMFGRYREDQTSYYDEFSRKWVRSRPDLIKMIDRQLTDNKNIVGIDYMIKLIGRDPYDTSSHSSVIVGRRQVNGQCQYKIRNSWGPGCSIKDGNQVYPRYGKNVVACLENGHVWVSAANLRANLTDIAYIRP
ncbi:MAG: hypothetical protein JNL11_17670 [Bdellovibrionaceae bacterium]|nr:hypothetical protein [Pseudobdellovibrionaceae bacterium]